MIKSFRDKATEKLWRREVLKGFDRRLLERALLKLRWLDAATSLDDLRTPPSNRLEKLVGSRSGQWSIRVNDQYRLCFRWTDGAENVEFVDYH